jgi:peptidoglycan/LPS O-acetylase OafA/YrhL
MVPLSVAERNPPRFALSVYSPTLWPPFNSGTSQQFAVRLAPLCGRQTLRSGSDRENFYRPELDSLRFFAFLMVFFCHALVFEPTSFLARHVPHLIFVWVVAVCSSGAFGVDVFFTLSAYLITELLLREKDMTGRVHVNAFYARRILRIWPLYFTAIGIGYGAHYIWSAQHLPAIYIYCFLALSGNWICAIHGAVHSIIMPLWSVSIEEQFYLSWPRAVRKLTRKKLCSAALVLLVLATVSRMYFALHHYSQVMFWCSTLTRIDPIIGGILLAVLLRGRTPRWSGRLRIMAFAGGIGGMAATGAWFRILRTNEPPMFWNAVLGYPMIAVFVIIVFLAVLGAPQAGATWMNRTMPRYLGKISYGLYVFHMLGLLIVSSLLKALPRYIELPLTVAGGFCVTLLLAATSYRFLEQPFLRMKDRFTYILSDRPARNPQPVKHSGTRHARIEGVA